MKGIMFLAFLFLSLTVGAQSIKDEIHSIVKGQDGNPHLVKFESGQVKFIENHDKKTLAAFEAKLKTKRPKIQNKMLLQEETFFEPTVLSDSEIQSIAQRMNNFMRRKSECSDRAHVWAWDEFQKTGAKSEKVFLMLTNDYIVRNRYKWWFHVAPLFTSSSGEKYVTDMQFYDRPVTFTEWKNSLVFSKRECVTDFTFNAYNAGADQTQDCYVKFEPMYYRIPADIGMRENGKPRTGWSTSEVNAARSRAFFKGSVK